MSENETTGSSADAEAPDTDTEPRGPGDGAPEARTGDEADGADETTERIRQALRSVTDPELGINIVDLGLVYDIEVEEGSARVTMTLTSPGCPAGGQIMTGAKNAAESVDGVDEATVSLVWKPFWTPERIDPKIRTMMGF